MRPSPICSDSPVTLSFQHPRGFQHCTSWSRQWPWRRTRRAAAGHDNGVGALGNPRVHKACPEFSTPTQWRQWNRPWILLVGLAEKAGKYFCHPEVVFQHWKTATWAKSKCKTRDAEPMRVSDISWQNMSTTQGTCQKHRAEHC